MLSYILGSIIGTGVLTLPSLTLGINLTDVLFSLGLSSVVFAALGYLFSKTSNPFDDMRESISSNFCKILGVTYWVSIWTGTMLGIYEMSNEIFNLIGVEITRIKLAVCQVTIVILFILLQKVGMRYVNKVEIVITGLKIIFVVIIPIILVVHGFSNGYVIEWSLNISSIMSMIPQMMWMYLGIESCSIISNKEKDITSTVINSVFIIFFVYAINVIGVISTMNSTISLSSPYPALVANAIGKYHNLVRTLMSVVIITLCAGSTNSWYVMSAKTFQSLTSVFPVKYTSKYFYAVLFSSIGLIPLSILISSPDVKSVFSNLIDIFGIISALFYLSSSFAITKKYKTFYVGIPISLLLVCFFLYCVFNRIFMIYDMF
jgi:amino acid transporter